MQSKIGEHFDDSKVESFEFKKGMFAEEDDDDLQGLLSEDQDEEEAEGHDEEDDTEEATTEEEFKPGQRVNRPNVRNLDRRGGVTSKKMAKHVDINFFIEGEAGIHHHGDHDHEDGDDVLGDVDSFDDE